MCKIWLLWLCDFFFSGMSWKSSLLDPPPHKIERLHRNLGLVLKEVFHEKITKWSGRRLNQGEGKWIEQPQPHYKTSCFLAVVPRGFSWWGDWSSVRSGFWKCLVICKWKHCACLAVALNKFDANLAKQRIITRCYSESSSASRVHPNYSYQWLLC